MLYDARKLVDNVDIKEEAATKKVLEELSVDQKWNNLSPLIVEVFEVAGSRKFPPEER